MKFLYHILAILPVLLSSCSEEKAMPDTIDPFDGTMTVYFQSGGEVTTRGTNLIGSDNRQHAKYVHLYVFDKSGLCIQSNDVHWTRPVGVTAKQSYRLKGLKEKETYTLLAVGLDEIPTPDKPTTYGLPEAVTVGQTTLADLKATLATGKTTKDIATTELLSGWEEVTAGQTSGVVVNLYRRVAGVLVYVKDIPADVAEIKVRLYKNQYANVPLQKADKDNKCDINDHGNMELADSRILMTIPVSDDIKNNTELNDGHGFTLTKQVGSVLQGAYVLPLEAPTAGIYTIALETYSANDKINPLKTYNVKMLTKTENGGMTEEQIMVNYPLFANQFYSLGKKSAKVDEPVSLGDGSSDIVIIVNPDWHYKIELPME